ncbi:sulfurtransferase TusA family protein [Vibrio sp. RC27]
MKPVTLDLREQRCPLSLLLVKRELKMIPEGKSLRILICDEASFRDIQRYLQRDYDSTRSRVVSDGFQIDVTKEVN